MPANKKYLTQSPWHRFAKISAGIFGGYAITVLFHMCLPLFLPYPKEVLITSIFSIFVIWCALLVVPFLFDNGWKAWLLYLGVISFLYAIYYFGTPFNPFI
ncbi:MAG: hypothetical protein HRU40_03505 [Saprospiraceae bacterium]|nr:hypothetical protein [Saprospiraceae bacterium]